METQSATARNPWWRGWGPVVFMPAAALLISGPSSPPWLLMALLCVALYAGCKWLTWARTSVPGAPPWRHIAYLGSWPGLDAQAFLSLTKLRPEDRPCPREWASAAGMVIAGLGILWAAVLWIPRSQPLLRGGAGMAGLILILHCGIFHFLSCFWRSRGVDARPLMVRPHIAVSLSDFWGRRWNTAFRDLTHRFVFAPLRSCAGPRAGVAAGFFFSGLVHDLVISVPAGAGYGLPTLYFLLQGAALLFERSRNGRRLHLGRGWRGRVFAHFVVAAPVCLLFHPPFLSGVIAPMLDVFVVGTAP